MNKKLCFFFNYRLTKAKMEATSMFKLSSMAVSVLKIRWE